MQTKSRAPSALRVIWRAIIDWWDSWIDNTLMTILWILCQATIILGPLATFGVYYVAHEQVNGQSLGLLGMIQGARKYWWQSLVWGLANLVVAFLIYINYQFYGAFESGWGFGIQVLVIILSVIWVGTQFYLLPYFFVLEHPSLRTALRNGFLTFMASPFFALALLLIVVIDLVVSFGIMIPAFLGLPAIIPYLGYRGVYSRLEAFGLREPEKTPQEIEAERGSRISVENVNPIARKDHIAGQSEANSTGGSLDKPAPGSDEVSNGKG